MHLGLNSAEGELRPDDLTCKASVPPAWVGKEAPRRRISQKYCYLFAELCEIPGVVSSGLRNENVEC